MTRTQEHSLISNARHAGLLRSTDNLARDRDARRLRAVVSLRIIGLSREEYLTWLARDSEIWASGVASGRFVRP